LPEKESALPDPDKVREAFEGLKRSNESESAFESFEQGERPTNSDAYKEPFECSNQNGEGRYTPPLPLLRRRQNGSAEAHRRSSFCWA
jgi:hypothetical protein